ncbi:AraC family transcriptional regulator [Congregibacter brevis]|uniref:AraC family transcriptional regulator n=1 Tax=Congregibacter brevis TaxID=3081201 RepID=A0ABZ0IA90_9GAMM|nr:AraC family transcriptional regulator [Congregibacter sp. IMCC45268]
MEKTPVNKALIGRHTEGLHQIWPLMQSLGVSVSQCLAGTGLSEGQAWGREGGMTLEQEFHLYRNLLQLSGDPMLGLKLGALYHPQSYGMFGYAMMSARTVGTITDLASRYFDLFFSHFQVVDYREGNLWETRLEQRYPIPADLMQVFSDRDIEAGYTIFDALGLERPIFSEIHFCYLDEGNLAAYEEHFGCTVKMGCAANAFVYPPSLADRELPWRNDQAFEACMEACRTLLDDLRGPHSLSSRVVDRLISNPGETHSIEHVAEDLAISTRSLRRKLNQEGTRYQDLLREVRLRLAKQYLRDRLTVNQTAELLGYSETSAFSRAFKRWTGRSPIDFRSSESGTGFTNPARHSP